jgi:hypothetical protein
MFLSSFSSTNVNSYIRAGKIVKNHLRKKKLPAHKILNKWKKIISEGDSKLKDKKLDLIDVMLKTPEENIEVLTKSTKVGNKTRTTVTGLAAIRQNKVFTNEYTVDYLVGNPASGDKFKGAIDSLGETLKRNYLVEDGKRNLSKIVTLSPTNAKVRDLYVERLGMRPSIDGLMIPISRLKTKVPEIDSLPKYNGFFIGDITISI